MRHFKLFSLMLTVLFCASAAAQSAWDVQRRDREILIDGFLDEWESVPGLVFAPESKGLRRGGTFEGPEDVKLLVRALWDEEYLYLGLTWQDNVWDVKEVTRKDAVWVDAQGKRRDRMYFFDYFKFHIRRSDYDYTFWVSPRVNEEGPFQWSRLLEGYKGMERAAGSPMITAREQDGRMTLEMMLLWKQLKLEPKTGADFPLTLVLSDSDHPGRVLDFKTNYQKWLGWVGTLTLAE